MTEKPKTQETAPPPLLFFRDIVGQDRVLAQLQTARKRGRLAHAHLFLGPDGVGKESVARALAAALNCTKLRDDGDACGECPSCRRMLAGTHPDFHLLAPTSEGHQPQIKIEQVREFRRLTSYPPVGGGWRVALIKPAAALTAQNDAAANALLKTLEEPPARHLIILTAGVEADLLPTVASRCQKLTFTPLPTPLVAQELQKRRGLPPDQAALLAALSGGSLGRALAQDLQEVLQRRQKVLADLAQLSQGPYSAALDWAQRLAKNRAELDNFFLLAQLWYRDLLLLSANAPAALLGHRDLLSDLEQEQQTAPARTWFARFAALGAAQRHLQANLNPELTLDILGMRLKRGYTHDPR